MGEQSEHKTAGLLFCLHLNMALCSQTLSAEMCTANVIVDRILEDRYVVSLYVYYAIDVSSQLTRDTKNIEEDQSFIIVYSMGITIFGYYNSGKEP